MNKKTLTTAVLAGLTGIAGIVSVSNAVHINPDGTGQVLVYPYYTTRGDNVTLISIVNTTEDGKAVKVRFIEGMNSREVRDFNLYMSPFDVWTAAISDNGTGGAGFVTTDNSCTAPYFFNNGTADGSSAGAPGSEFSTFLFNDVVGGAGPTSGLDRTREGYVEMIEMGTLTNAVEDSLAAATHTGPDDVNGNPTPADCQQLVDAWRNPGPNPYWILDAQTDMAPPTGGLFGDGTIVNVANGRAMGYAATALDGFYVPGDLDPVSLHELPASPQPDLTDVLPTTSYSVLATGAGAPVVVSDDWAIAPQAVTAVFMSNQVMNQYAVEDATNAVTEWVVTHPTKRFHTFDQLPGPAVAPFTVQWNPETGTACQPIDIRIWDRNEQESGTAPGDVEPSPAPPPEIVGNNFCWEVNTVGFNNGQDIVDAGQTAALGSKLSINFDVDSATHIPEAFSSGWAQISFPQTMVNDLGTREYVGLPVTGFAVRTANADGGDDDATNDILFGAAYDHAYARVIQAPAPAPAP
ncbi:MAG: hypothetical protein Tsb0027_09630 [Wenzhouxiangellaceae bacterium]